MSDSGSPIGQFSEEVQETAGEVVSEIKDAAGEIIEQGLQSVVVPQLTPQQIQQKQQQEQGQLTKARQKILWIKNLQQEQAKVRQANQQKESERLQAEQQEVSQKKTEEIQVSQGSKKPGAAISEEVARTRQEIGKGHGVGG